MFDCVTSDFVHIYVTLNGGYRRKNFIDAVDVTINTILASRLMTVMQQM
jgi:hypothetical protein